MGNFEGNALSPALYFLSGALLPTFAFIFFLRNQKNDFNMANSKTDSMKGIFDDDDSDYDFEFPDSDFAEIDNPKSWGIADAPYKVLIDFHFTVLQENLSSISE
mmetsp:Transcript_12873/g.18381  ORF Transcript_12873/g.18381 Transcript_12873/m.18381 type:complete len:104 (-) Transcript_12873:290-601(-)